MLLEYNANVNCIDLWKFTPLHEAAAKGKYEICKLLLKVSLCHQPLLQCGVTVNCHGRHCSMELMPADATVRTSRLLTW